ncbi:hypothetical protein [Kineosporia succinea]
MVTSSHSPIRPERVRRAIGSLSSAPSMSTAPSPCTTSAADSRTPESTGALTARTSMATAITPSPATAARQNLCAAGDTQSARVG